MHCWLHNKESTKSQEMMKPKLHTSCDLDHFHSYARKCSGNYARKGIKIVGLYVHHIIHDFELAIGMSEQLIPVKA